MLAEIQEAPPHDQEKEARTMKLASFLLQNSPSTGRCSTCNCKAHYLLQGTNQLYCWTCGLRQGFLGLADPASVGLTKEEDFRNKSLQGFLEQLTKVDTLLDGELEKLGGEFELKVSNHTKSVQEVNTFFQIIISQLSSLYSSLIKEFNQKLDKKREIFRLRSENVMEHRNSMQQTVIDISENYHKIVLEMEMKPFEQIMVDYSEKIDAARSMITAKNKESDKSSKKSQIDENFKDFISKSRRSSQRTKEEKGDQKLQGELNYNIRQVNDKEILDLKNKVRRIVEGFLFESDEGGKDENNGVELKNQNKNIGRRRSNSLDQNSAPYQIRIDSEDLLTHNSPIKKTQLLSLSNLSSSALDLHLKKVYRRLSHDTVSTYLNNDLKLKNEAQELIKQVDGFVGHSNEFQLLPAPVKGKESSQPRKMSLNSNPINFLTSRKLHIISPQNRRAYLDSDSKILKRKHKKRRKGLITKKKSKENSQTKLKEPFSKLSSWSSLIPPSLPGSPNKSSNNIMTSRTSQVQNKFFQKNDFKKLKKKSYLKLQMSPLDRKGQHRKSVSPQIQKKYSPRAREMKKTIFMSSSASLKKLNKKKRKVNPSNSQIFQKMASNLENLNKKIKHHFELPDQRISIVTEETKTEDIKIGQASETGITETLKSDKKRGDQDAFQSQTMNYPEENEHGSERDKRSSSVFQTIIQRKKMRGGGSSQNGVIQKSKTISGNKLKGGKCKSSKEMKSLTRRKGRAAKQKYFEAGKEGTKFINNNGEGEGIRQLTSLKKRRNVSDNAEQ